VIDKVCQNRNKTAHESFLSKYNDSPQLLDMNNKTGLEHAQLTKKAKESPSKSKKGNEVEEIK
jgi:hypothetical protein